MALTRRLTVIGGETNPNDWQIMEGDKSVGRIHMAVTTSNPVWMWNLHGDGPQLEAHRGRAGSFEEARGAFMAAWDASIEERLDRIVRKLRGGDRR